jgi:hypothetical protein
MSKHANLRVLPAEPLGEDIVEMLETALAWAKDGAISSAALSLVMRDGTTEAAFSSPPNSALLIGAIARTQYRLTRRLESDE